MVKGVSRQVIVVHSPDPKLFDQAIFILRDDVVGAEGITDEKLLQEAKALIRNPSQRKRRPWYVHGPIWAGLGAAAASGIWLLCICL